MYDCYLKRANCFRSIACRVVLETFNDDLAGRFVMEWSIEIKESLEMLSAQTNTGEKKINVLNVFIRQLLGDISVYK